MRLKWLIAACITWTGFTIPGAVIVYSNNTPLDDAFTNPSATNQGQAIGASGWYYNNVRNGGTVGIAGSLPWAGNGSVYFQSPSGAAKADVEYLADGVNIGGNFAAAGSLGFFSDLAWFSYEWYRNSASTNPAVQHPALRVLLDADGNLSTVSDRGGLVFERAYNGGVVPVDTWVFDAVGPSTYLWNFGLGIGFAANINATPSPYDATLAEWQAYFPNAVILGFSAGVGSGWNGQFYGAVDAISWNLGGVATETNFETGPLAEIPEPSSLMLVASGLALLWRRGRA